MARADDAALASVCGAVSRVLEVDPGVLRADTPLADIGCDPVALLAIVDLLAADGPGGVGESSGGGALDARIGTAATVGDLVAVLGWSGGP